MATKQARLPGTDDPVIEEIEAAAESYRELRDERMALASREKQARDVLLERMKKHRKRTYVNTSYVIEIEEAEEKVFVRGRKDAEEEE